MKKGVPNYEKLLPNFKEDVVLCGQWFTWHHQSRWARFTWGNIIHGHFLSARPPPPPPSTHLPGQWLQPGAVVGCGHVGAGSNPKALSGGQERRGAASQSLRTCWQDQGSSRILLAFERFSRPPVIDRSFSLLFSCSRTKHLKCLVTCRKFRTVILYQRLRSTHLRK